PGATRAAELGVRKSRGTEAWGPGSRAAPARGPAQPRELAWERWKLTSRIGSSPLRPARAGTRNPDRAESCLRSIAAWPQTTQPDRAIDQMWCTGPERVAAAWTVRRTYTGTIALRHDASPGMFSTG